MEHLIEERQFACWDSEDPMPRDVLLKECVGKSGILCTLNDKIDLELLNTCGEQLRVVSTMSVGVDHINVEECERRGIRVFFTPNLTETTAELAASLLLAVNRRLVESERAVRSGEWGAWKPEWLLGRDIFQSTVGVYGLGRIGEHFARIMLGFSPQKILYSGGRGRKPEAEERLRKLSGGTIPVQYVEDFNEFLASCDVVSNHCAYTSSTHHLFNEAAFQAMKSSAVLINTGRGKHVDQEALVHALQSGAIAGAGLDVTDPEPLPTDHPLLDLPTCLITPHIGSASIQTRRNMAQLALHQLDQGLQ